MDWAYAAFAPIFRNNFVRPNSVYELMKFGPPSLILVAPQVFHTHLARCSFSVFLMHLWLLRVWVLIRPFFLGCSEIGLCHWLAPGNIGPINCLLHVPNKRCVPEKYNSGLESFSLRQGFIFGVFSIFSWPTNTSFSHLAHFQLLRANLRPSSFWPVVQDEVNFCWLYVSTRRICLTPWTRLT